MSVQPLSVQPSPDHDALAELTALAAQHFGLVGSARALPGYAGVNAAITGGPDGTGAVLGVLKVHPGLGLDSDEALVLALGARAQAALAGRGLGPAPIHAPDGEALRAITFGGRRGVAQALSWVAGGTWATSRDKGTETLRELGRLMARVDAALGDFGADLNPGERALLARTFDWNLAQAPRLLADLEVIADTGLRAFAQRALSAARDELAPVLADLEPQPVHNDPNDANIICGAGGRPVALIDLGDLALAPRVCDLAIACTYALATAVADGELSGTGEDPLAWIVPIVAGYHEVLALDEVELGIIPALIRTRVAASMVMARRSHAAEPENHYLLVSQPAMEALAGLLGPDQDELVLCRLRAACGFEPARGGRAVREYLATAEVSPLLGRWPHELNPLRGDWSAGTGASTVTEAEIWAQMRAAGAEVLFGRYLEDRDVYTTPAFAGAGGERRTVHLGVDVFVPAGTALRAPLAGVVEIAVDNDAPQDYGPVVILRHEIPGGTSFFTLYGHLARTTLAQVSTGQRVEAGEIFAWVGEQSENGGWPPHAHVQVLVSLVGLGRDVPGVARRSELGVWQSLCPDPNLVLRWDEGLRAPSAVVRPGMAAERRARLSPALSLSYSAPLTIVRGSGAYLFDEQGQGWLDLVNNVAHVGHCHPRVVGAAAAQQSRLNTNTRYLHGSVIEYGRRLAETLPDPLSVCFFTNSGSEANDLALRLAFAHTRSREVFVLDHAYHGNLTSLVDVSPYKFRGPGGWPTPEHTHVVPLACSYRGRLGVGGAEPYLAALDDLLAATLARGRRPAAFLAESIPGTAGQVMLEPGFLAGAYDRVRAAGGVVIADEVQTGFGRVGDAFWAFESGADRGLVPDIVTMGKPIGNGHPLGAVVTTPEVARSFVTGMEYFNTFGGNPVSAEVGLAVLDVIADERLQAHAAAVGAELLAGLAAVGARHAAIGDVRGRGLFLGIELDATAAQTTAVVEAIKHRGILISSDGPDHNVLKIKPPMVISAEDCARVVRAVDEAVAGVFAGIAG